MYGNRDISLVIGRSPSIRCEIQRPGMLLYSKSRPINKKLKYYLPGAFLRFGDAFF
jgi:hypothetical protein